jgi:hypothetical protein
LSGSRVGFPIVVALASFLEEEAVVLVKTPPMKETKNASHWFF